MKTNLSFRRPLCFQFYSYFSVSNQMLMMLEHLRLKSLLFMLCLQCLLAGILNFTASYFQILQHVAV